MNQIMDILAQRPDDFVVLSGVDEITFSMMGLGADGVISVVGNVAPEAISAMLRSCVRGELSEARKQHFELLPLVKCLFLDTNPIPVKYAMSLMGLCANVYRLPLCDSSPEVQKSIRDVLRNHGADLILSVDKAAIILRKSSMHRVSARSFVSMPMLRIVS